MEKEFLDYPEALELKELGFNEPCWCYFMGDVFNSSMFLKDYEYLDTMPQKYTTYTLAPLYQQAFRWFRDKYDLNSLVVFDKYICEIDDKELENPYFTYYYSINELWSEGKDYSKFTRGFINVASNRDMLSYEEAELACLEKLIEIVK
jgi:hypothetical protein